MRIFTGRAHPQLGFAICKHLGVASGLCEVSSFSDSEINVRILDDVRGLDAFVVQPTCLPVNDNLMELLIMVDALRRASAGRITAVLPYYGYARQDRKHEGRVPITAKLVANLLVEAGVNRVLCMDLHAQQIQGFFDIPMDHLYARPVIVRYLRQKQFAAPVVVSPDVGSAKMALAFCQALGGAEMAIIEKRRSSGSEIEHGFVIGNLRDRDVIIVDDMISTAGSMASAVAIARQNGAKSVMVAVSHGLFVKPAWERLAEVAPVEIVTTDTVPQHAQETPPDVKLTVLSVAPTLAEAIVRIHRNQSVSALF
ncbi:MAG: ribose-phosphate pyrophosphokinase [Planctomycetota bacterium]|jgi:ribose-phosphate pyrophosphokinase|nr:ribose-phosphate pyrophosphokinase [Planctomycetota bacterium]